MRKLTPFIITISIFLFTSLILVYLSFGGSDAVNANSVSDTTRYKPIQWQSLLTTHDKTLLQTLAQKQTELDAKITDGVDVLEGQLVSSVLTAATWNELDGYETNEDFHGEDVAIPGFVVPLELDDRKLLSFFIVPYYGACIHYPAPPPNQMIYVQLENPIKLPPLQQPFLFRGNLTPALFEDMLGTSAWILAMDDMNEYQGEPDTARQH
ncbi:MAG: DUF3299 domain-containing protein [Alteromonadaceae bacterium]|nr:DUF3299 domain-containing protein [Alteromonadaceae bacterium]